MEVLVKPWNNYQLYFRDPRTRSFKPVQSPGGKKLSIKFNQVNNKLFPKQIVIFKMQPKQYDGYDRMFSRKQDLHYIDLPEL